jgi:hypothetical protein
LSRKAIPISSNSKPLHQVFPWLCFEIVLRRLMKHNLVCANFVVLVYWRCLQPTVPLLQPPPTSRVLFNITTWAKEYNLGDPVAGVFFRATKGEYWSPLGNHVEVQSSNLNNTELSKYDSYFIDQALSLNFNNVSRHKMNKISLHFPSLICFLWLVRALENNLFLCPLWPSLGFAHVAQTWVLSLCSSFSPLHWMLCLMELARVSSQTRLFSSFLPRLNLSLCGA